MEKNLTETKFIKYMDITRDKLYLKYKRAATTSNHALYSISSATLPFLFFHK